MAPEPPRGEPLLTQNDSQLLMDFFQDVNSNQFNFSFGEGLSFSEDWLNLPPTFMGSSTSFGQQPAQPYSSVPPDFLGLDPPDINHVYHFGESMPSPHTPQPPHTPLQHHYPQQHQQHHPITQSHQHTSPHYPPQPQPQQHRPQPRYQESQHQHHQMHQSHPQPQVTLQDHSAQQDIAAVLTAMGNGNQNGHSQGGHSIAQHHNGRPTPFRSPTEPTRPTNQQHFGLQRQSSHPGLQIEEETDVLFTNMVFGNRIVRQSRHPEERTELLWGSDANFNKNQAYIPSSHNETAEALEKERLQYIKCFSLNKSAANTQPSSPNPTVGESSFALNGHLGTVPETIEGDGPMPSTKRRKSKAKVDISGAISNEPATFVAKPLPPPPPPKKRKPKADANGTTFSPLASISISAAAAAPAAPSETPKRKRPSASAKPTRENLTDTQKRENHIKSEQRRRGAIKEGFDGLTEIIPNLKAGGYSKSMMLGMAGDWLQKLLDGNRALAEQQPPQ